MTEILGVIIATLAVALSLVTVVLQRRQQRRDAYRQMHDLLMSLDVQRGRWVLENISESGEVPPIGADNFRFAARTLGLYDTVSMYMVYRVIPYKWVLDVWHHPLEKMERAADLMAKKLQRERSQDWMPWPYLWQLLEWAKKYPESPVRRWNVKAPSPLPCCSTTPPSV